MRWWAIAPARSAVARLGRPVALVSPNVFDLHLRPSAQKKPYRSGAFHSSSPTWTNLEPP